MVLFIMVGRELEQSFEGSLQACESDPVRTCGAFKDAGAFEGS